MSYESNPEEGGDITGDEEGSYETGTEVTITADPATDYQFDNWEVNGEIVSTEPELTLVMDENKHAIANFSLA